MKKILFFGVILLGIILFTGCVSQPPTQEPPVQPIQESEETPKEPSVRIETLSDFENSEFCKLYACSKEDSWSLRSGGTSNVYKNNIYPTVSISVSSSGEEVIGFGLVFYYRNQLSEDDLQIIYNFLKSVDTEKELTNIQPYIQTNIEKKVPQIKQAIPSTFSSYNVYAGKVGQQQIVSLEMIIDNIQESQTNIKKLGDLVVSGEDAGVCVVSEINMWSEPKSSLDGSYVVGKIPNACPKTEVPYYEERDLRTLNGRIWYKVESGNNVGWITDSFVIQIK